MRDLPEGSIIEWVLGDGTRNVAVLDIDGWWVTGEMRACSWESLGLAGAGPSFTIVRRGDTPTDTQAVNA